MAFTNAASVVGLLVFVLHHAHHASALRLATPHNKGDLVTRVPSYPFPVEHYAGRIAVGSKRTTRIFYYFVPAQNAPAHAPLIVWMQNSMTCSSMLGLVYEHGPFRLRSAGNSGVQVVSNPHSWHRIANVLYVDIPGGMGFSTAAAPGMDAVTASGQMVQFMAGFYARHAAMRKVSLFLSAETSGVPTMLITAQRLARELPTAPLRGYIAISGWTNQCQYWQAAQPRFLLEQRLISRAKYNSIAKTCGNKLCQSSNRPCGELQFLELEVLALSDRTTRVPVSCPPQFGRRRLQTTPRTFPEAALAGPLGSSSSGSSSGGGSVGAQRRLQAGGKRKVAGGSFTCGAFDLAAMYFNRNDVRKALHLPPMVPSKPATRWEACGGFSVPMDLYKPDNTPTLPRHRDLLVNKGMRALLLHGAQDFKTPYTGARALAADVGLSNTLATTVVRVRGKRVGAAQAYGRGRGRQLNFVVLDGAGAFLTEDKPAAALEVVKRFLVRRKIEK